MCPGHPNSISHLACLTRLRLIQDLVQDVRAELPWLYKLSEAISQLPHTCALTIVHRRGTLIPASNLFRFRGHDA